MGTKADSVTVYWPGKNAGKHPSVASLYRVLAEAEDTAA